MLVDSLRRAISKEPKYGQRLMIIRLPQIALEPKCVLGIEYS